MNNIQNMFQRLKRSFWIILNNLKKQEINEILNKNKEHGVIDDVIKIQAISNISSDFNKIIKKENNKENNVEDYIKEFDYYYDKIYLREKIKKENIDYYDTIRNLLTKEIDFLYNNLPNLLKIIK